MATSQGANDPKTEEYVCVQSSHCYTPSTCSLEHGGRRRLDFRGGRTTDRVRLTNGIHRGVIVGQVTLWVTVRARQPTVLLIGGMTATGLLRWVKQDVMARPVP